METIDGAVEACTGWEAETAVVTGLIGEAVECDYQDLGEWLPATISEVAATPQQGTGSEPMSSAQEDQEYGLCQAISVDTTLFARLA